MWQTIPTRHLQQALTQGNSVFKTLGRTIKQTIHTMSRQFLSITSQIQSHIQTKTLVLLILPGQKLQTSGRTIHSRGMKWVSQFRLLIKQNSLRHMPTNNGLLVNGLEYGMKQLILGRTTLLVGTI